MISRKTYPFQRARAWFGLLVAVGGALVLLAACGGANTPSTGTGATPTTLAHTPTVGASSTTPTLTVAPPTPTPAPGSTQILMIINNSNGSFGFSPATLTIKVGTTVIWKNMSLAAHTITSDDGQTFDSGSIAVGGTFRFTFTTAGAFPYHCNYHPYMRSTIVVV